MNEAEIYHEFRVVTVDPPPVSRQVTVLSIQEWPGLYPPDNESKALSRNDRKVVAAQI